MRRKTVKLICPLSVCRYELENPVIDPKKCPGCQMWRAIDASRARANKNRSSALQPAQKSSATTGERLE
jgi:hypothetical protein